MFTGQWDISISILGTGFSISVPMILVWILLFLIGLTLILTQIQISYTLPSGTEVVGNVFKYLFDLLIAALRGL